MQTPDERSHNSSFIVISSAEKTAAEWSGRRAPGIGRNISTSVVAVLSNYHFNRDEQVAKFKPCTLADCSVGLKYSSSDFVGSNENSDRDAGFHFDKFGLLTPYEAFVSLFTSNDFGAYITRCQNRYSKTTETNAAAPDEEEEEDDDEVEQSSAVTVVVKKAEKKKKISDADDSGPSRKKSS